MSWGRGSVGKRKRGEEEEEEPLYPDLSPPTKPQLTVRLPLHPPHSLSAASVWVHQDFYPGVPSALLDAGERRERIRKQLLLLDADVLLLQEVQEEEVPLLFEVGDLKGRYELHFAANPPEVWASWLTSTNDFMPRSNGVLIAWKPALFIVTPSFHDVTLDDVMGVRASSMVASVKEWGGKKAVFAVTHLDVDSVQLADLQATNMLAEIGRLKDATGAEHVVWGGDFNVEAHSPVISSILRKGFSTASDSHGQAKVHSVMTTCGSSRIDHILVAGIGLECTDSLCPKSPLPYILGHTPLLSTRQWLRDEIAPLYSRHRWIFLAVFA